MDYKNLTIRTVSGAVLVTLIVVATMMSGWYFTALFGLIAILTTHEFMNINGMVRWKSWIAAVASLAMFLLPMVEIKYNVWVAAVWILILVGMFAMELWLKADDPIRNWGIFALSQLYVALPFTLMHILQINSEISMVLVLFVMIWVNDTFAFLTGSFLGRHRMFERVSPKKSWEGFVGGNIFTLAAAFILWMLYPRTLDLCEWFIIAEIIVIFGTLGDLVESLMKRTLGLKDSGHIIPGHGGMLDRFDSAILAAPMLYVVILIINSL